MPIFNNILAGASGQTGGAPTAYTISRSLRFNSGDSAYLSKVFSSAGNRRTWTYSFWVKKAAPGGGDGNGYLSSATTVGSTTPMFVVRDPNDQLDILNNTGGGSTNFRLTTTAVYRDFSAWYHILLAIDTTQATASNRAKLYVNGAEVTQFSTATYPAQNTDLDLNGSITHNIGREAARSNYYSNFFLADVHFIDGQALDPTSFGEFDEYNNWQPKAYTHSPAITSSSFSLADNDFTWSGLRTSSANTPSSGVLTDGNLNYAETFWGNNGADGSYLDIDMTGAAAGETFQVRYWNAAEAAGQTITATCKQIDSNGSDISGTASSQTWSQGQKWNTYSQTIAANCDRIRLIFSNNSNNSFGWGIGEVEVTLTPTNVNDFHLDFSDATSTTTIAEDSSGNNNDWTANNISVTAGAGNDSLFDSPTNSGTDTGAGGEVSGNYCTGNPLAQVNHTLTNGNLDVLCGSSDGVCQSTFGMSSGKWYCEWTSQGAPSEPYGNTNKNAIGLSKSGVNLSSYLGSDSNGWQYYSINGNKVTNGTSTSYGSTYVSGDIIGVAFDADNGTLTFYKNNVSQGVAFTGLTDGPYFFSTGSSYVKGVFNFGQRPFAYTAPSGFKALCTQNLDDPTIADGSTAMDAVLYTGTGSNQSITGLNFSPDFVWIKSRSTGQDNNVFDAVRGPSSNLYALQTNATTAEGQYGTMGSLDSNGFSLTGGGGATNFNGTTYVGWTWDGGSSTVSNTDGSITSSVRANASAGFSIVTYTGQVSAGSIGHGLNAAPSLIITKARSNAQSWGVYHASTGINNYLLLDSTSAATAYSGIWGSSAPTSTVFNVPGNVGLNNYGSWTYVAYCFAPVEGYSAFGSYTGNGSSDGPFVYTGFRPKFLLVKGNATIDWIIEDSSRDPFNQMNKRLYPNDSVAESTSSNGNLDFLSNGFKPRTSHASLNSSGTTYIYAAFAEHPFRTSRAR